MLFIQPTVRRTREEDLQQGKPQGCRQSHLDHSWSLLRSYRVSEGVKLSGECCPD